MQRAGFAPEDYASDPVEVWPENWPAWCLFCSMATQWRVGGMGGPVGLDYTPVFMRMERMQLSQQEWEFLFADLQYLESAALTEMRKNHD